MIIVLENEEERFREMMDKDRTIVQTMKGLVSFPMAEAEELIDILSAPSLKITLKSSTVRIPPPTVNGINTVSATLRTISIIILRASEEAVISKKTNSSAPALS